MKYSRTMSDLLRQVDEKSRDLTEGKLNETGHTDVASAKNQVKIAMSALQKMEGELGKLKDEDNLPSWWTNKVAISVDKLDGMADYLDTQVESKQVNEESMKCPRCGTMNETPFDKCSNCGLPKAEFSSFKKEEVEELEEGQAGRFRSAGAELERYAKSSGGMDKKDFMKAAQMMKKGDSHGLVAFANKLDTSPKEYIIQTVARAVGKDLTQKMFGVKIREAVDPADKDIVATADDRKAADKNIIMQLRRLQDMKGKGKAMFGDKKATKINPKLIDFALKAHGKMKPQDKLKFQKDISKSYRDFLMTLKRTR